MRWKGQLALDGSNAKNAEYIFQVIRLIKTPLVQTYAEVFL